jgi:flagellar basal body-associated protein FliL
MKKNTAIIIVVIIAILLVGAGYLLIFKKSPNQTLPQTQTTEPTREPTTPPQKETASFDTNDYLDQAFEDLDQVE